MTERIAAVGIARIAPTSPYSSPPINSATMTATGLTPTRRSMIFGTRMFASSWCSTRKYIPTVSASFGDTVSATATAVTPPMIGPITGIVSPIAAMSAMT